MLELLFCAVTPGTPSSEDGICGALVSWGCAQNSQGSCLEDSGVHTLNFFRNSLSAFSAFRICFRVFGSVGGNCCGWGTFSFLRN